MLVNFLPSLALNCDPPNLYHLNSCDYRLRSLLWASSIFSSISFSLHHNELVELFATAYECVYSNFRASSSHTNWDQVYHPNLCHWEDSITFEWSNRTAATPLQFALTFPTRLTHPWAKQGFPSTWLLIKDPHGTIYSLWVEGKGQLQQWWVTLGPGLLVQPACSPSLMLDPGCATCILWLFVLGPSDLMTRWCEKTQLKMSCSGGLITWCPMIKYFISTRSQGWEMFFKRCTVLHCKWYTPVQETQESDSSTGVCRKHYMCSLRPLHL
jgi:hypothetical protein